jgi:hypothetical protein
MLIFCIYCKVLLAAKYFTHSNIKPWKYKDPYRSGSNKHSSILIAFRQAHKCHKLTYILFKFSVNACRICLHMSPLCYRIAHIRHLCMAKAILDLSRTPKFRLNHVPESSLETWPADGSKLCLWRDRLVIPNANKK